MMNQPLSRDLTRLRLRQNQARRLDWLAPLRAMNERVFFPYRYDQLTRLLTPHLQDVATVLDVGASCGRLARRLMDATGCSISGIDVHIQPHAKIPVRRYDGRSFPFPDSAFDCVMMVDMLHHTENIEQMLSEACRVSRRYVLIKDHYWETGSDLTALRIADYIGNAPYGISLPYTYLRLDEWANLFHRHGLKPLSWETPRLHPLDPCKHITVRLERKHRIRGGTCPQ